MARYVRVSGIAEGRERRMQGSMSLRLHCLSRSASAGPLSCSRHWVSRVELPRCLMVTGASRRCARQTGAESVRCAQHAPRTVSRSTRSAWFGVAPL